MNLFVFDKVENRKLFAKHFLKQVALQLEIDRLKYANIVEKEEELKAYFESKGFKRTQINRAGIQFNFEPNNTSKIETVTTVGFTFKNDTENKEIQILENKVVYIDSDYIKFEKFINDFKMLVDKLTDIKLTIYKINKVGLRKINSFIVDPVETYQGALDILNPCYFSIVRSGLPYKNSVNVNEEAIVLENENNLSLIQSSFRKISDKKYEVNLDFDLIRTFGTEGIDSFNIYKELDELNICHYNLFIWSLTDKMKEIMDGKEQ